MRQIISTLSAKQRQDFIILVVLSLITSILFILASFEIEVIGSGVGYVPTEIDFLRVVLLSSITSLVVNYLYRYITKYSRFLQVWLTFLSLLLLAFPQKTEYIYSQSKWNLVRRESYVFGVIYSIVSIGFYILDQLYLASDDYTLFKDAIESNLDNNSLNENVRERSTLENCLQIRKNSNNLRRILYPETYSNRKAPYHSSDELGELLSNTNSVKYLSSGTDRLGSNRPPINDALYNFDYSIGFESMLSALISVRTSQNWLPLRLQWLIDHLIWIIIQFSYDIGVSLVLSITFIYVPSTDDSKFTFLERYYYNRMSEFLLGVVLPLFLITSLLHILVAYSIWRQLKSLKILSKQVYITFGVFVSVSILLFSFGLVFG